MSMTFEQRIGLLKICKLARQAADLDLDDGGTDEAIAWIDRQLEEDAVSTTREQRSREWSAVGLCSRCGSDDGGSCICYAR